MLAIICFALLVLMISTSHLRISTNLQSLSSHQTNQMEFFSLLHLKELEKQINNQLNSQQQDSDENDDEDSH